MTPQQRQPVAKQIIYIASRLEAIANHFVFNPAGLSSASVKILDILRCNTMLTPSDILEKIGGTKSNVSQRLNFLEKEGFIARTHSQYSQDKRRVAIKLTAKGNKKLSEMHERLKKAQLHLEKHFTKAELDAHYAFFEKIKLLLDTEKNEIKKLF